MSDTHKVDEAKLKLQIAELQRQNGLLQTAVAERNKTIQRLRDEKASTPASAAAAGTPVEGAPWLTDPAAVKRIMAILTNEIQMGWYDKAQQFLSTFMTTGTFP